jgi:hypothetical protein
LLFEELKMDSGQWTVNVSTAWIYLKYIAEGDTTTVNCQLSTFHCEATSLQSNITAKQLHFPIGYCGLVFLPFCIDK